MCLIKGLFYFYWRGRQAAGVSTVTLRRWDLAGKLKPTMRTFGEHRRYAEQDILALLPQSERVNVCYARVSSHDQKSDLDTQVAFLAQYCAERGIQSTTIQDLGSGLNFKKKGLNILIGMILSRQVNTVYVTHKDRLLRFGSELLVSIARKFGTTIHFIEDTVSTFEQTLAKDVLEIITVFSAKLYGARSHKKKATVLQNAQPGGILQAT